MRGLLLLLAGCAAPVTEDADACADAPTWAGWGDGFFGTYCRACHSASAAERSGAPEGIDFDQLEEIQTWRSSIESAVLDRGTMPVGGGVPSEQLDRLAAFLACAEAGEGGELPEVDRPATSAEWGAEDVVAAWAEATSAGFPEVSRIRDTWWALLAQGDDGCPGSETVLTDDILTGCEAESGTYYRGVGEFVDYGEKGWRVWAECLIVDADGARFEAGGHAWRREWQATSTGAWRQRDSFDGTWLWEGDDGWLAEPVSGALEAMARRGPDGVLLTLDGAVTVRGLSVAARALSLGPNGEVRGALGIRDPSGAWHEATFDGGTCGALVFDEILDEGEVCLDLSALEALRASREDER